MKTNRSKKPRHQAYRSNFSGVKHRLEMFEGKKHLVVPLIMAKSTVPMNGGLILEAEMVPFAWNGVPVTVQHPSTHDGVSVPANDPKTLEKYRVGQVFNAQVINGDLRGEAWIDIAKANRVSPGLVQQIKAGTPVDVSTGYFCDTEPANGTINGKEYVEYHRNLKPEHLALLPGVEGACNFAEGCGVRSNKRTNPMKKKQKGLAATINAAVLALQSTLKHHERGADDDVRQICADLISSEDSPFTPDDEGGLRMMTPEALVVLRDQYLKKHEDDVEDEAPAEENEDDGEEEVIEDNADDEEEDKKEMKSKKNSATRRVNCSGDDSIAGALAMLNENIARLARVNSLSSDDRELLAELRANRVNKRKEVVSYITTNSRMTENQLKGMDLATLKTIADGILPTANFAGRPVPVANSKDEAVDAMSSHGTSAVASLINARKKKEA